MQLRESIKETSLVGLILCCFVSSRCRWGYMCNLFVSLRVAIAVLSVINERKTCLLGTGHYLSPGGCGVFRGGSHGYLKN